MMNEEQNIAPVSHDDGGSGGGGGGGSSNTVGGERNEEVGFKIILVARNNDRVELTKDKIYSDLFTSHHPNDVKALIGLLLEGGFLSHRKNLDNNDDEDNNNDDIDPLGINNVPVVDIITLNDYQKILSFISKILVSKWLSRDTGLNWIKWENGRICSLCLSSRENCYGETMISYRLGRSVKFLDQLSLLILGRKCDFCTSVPMELSKLAHLRLYGRLSRAGLAKWLSASKFPKLRSFGLPDYSNDGDCIGELLLSCLPRCAPNLMDFSFCAIDAVHLPVIAAKLDAADYHLDFERTTSINLREFTLAFQRSINTNADKEALVTILSHFKRVDKLLRLRNLLDLRSHPDDSDDTKRLNKKIEYLLKVNHSNARVLIPGCNDFVLETVGTQISNEPNRQSSEDQNIYPPNSTLPLSVWPKIVESAWKNQYFSWRLLPEDRPNATAIYTLLRPCGRSGAAGPCLAHLLTERPKDHLLERPKKRRRTLQPPKPISFSVLSSGPPSYTQS